MNQEENRDEIGMFIELVESLLPELPSLVGEDWPLFEDELTAYLLQVRDKPARAPVLCALILDLFGQYEQASRRLSQAIAQKAGGPTT